MQTDDPSELIPLTPPVYHVLLALGEQSLHGYAIMQAFEVMTDGAEQLLPGTLYATLARMVDAELVEETAPTEPDADRRRRYYRVTARGRAAAKLESERLRRLLALAEAQRLVPKGRA